MLGNPEYFTKEEIARFLQRLGSELSEEDGGVPVAVIEGRRMGPADEMVSERLYGEGVPHFRIAELERLMSEKLGEREVLMSLKLGYDRDRILRLLENEYLSDELFLKLLSLWRWESKELMEGESDARILTALLKRFLNAGNYESDIYYSPVSLLRLIRESDRSDLLDALCFWPEFTFRQQRGRSVGLHEALASSPALGEKGIETLRRRRERAVDLALAGNPALSQDRIEEFLARRDSVLDRRLAANPSIGDAHFRELLSRGEAVVETLLQRQRIDQGRLGAIVEALGWDGIPQSLAENERVAPEVFGELLSRSEGAFRQRLLENPSIPREALGEILESRMPEEMLALAGNEAMEGEALRQVREWAREEPEELRERIESALAGNPSTPVEILEELYASGREELMEALAANPGTPMEILHQLKLDFRYYPIVSHNPAFVERANFEMGMR